MFKDKKILLVVGLLVFLFLWFQFRPSLIKKTCAGYASEQACTEYGCNKDKYDFRYDKCLHEKGLK